MITTLLALEYSQMMLPLSQLAQMRYWALFTEGFSWSGRLTASCNASFSRSGLRGTGARARLLANAISHRFKVLWAQLVCLGVEFLLVRLLCAGNAPAKYPLYEPHQFALPRRTEYGLSATPGPATAQYHMYHACASAFGVQGAVQVAL